MRTRVGVALVTVCLGLAGCSLFGKKQTAQNANPKPFLGSDAPAQRETPVATTSGGPLPGSSGLLAGQVVDTSTGRPVKAFIEVKDLEDNVAKAAALDVETKEDGYFTILGVKPGRHYKLIARAKEGGELASGTVFVIPPKPNLFIRINKQFTTPNTPPVPDAPNVPGKKITPSAESSQERTPATSLDPPVKIAPSGEGTANPSSGGMGAGQGSNPPNIANVAEGFNRRSPDRRWLRFRIRASIVHRRGLLRRRDSGKRFRTNAVRSSPPAVSPSHFFTVRSSPHAADPCAFVRVAGQQTR